MKTNSDMRVSMEPSAVYRSIGEKIAVRRTDIGMTQAQLAERVKLSRASIANIERGKQSVLVHQLLEFVSALELSSVLELIPDLLGSVERGFFVLGGASVSADQRNQIEAIFAEAGGQTPLDESSLC